MRWQLAMVRWGISDKIQAGLLLAPISEDLLCAAFPVSNMPKLPTALSLPQQKLQQDSPPPAYSPSATISEDEASWQGGLPGEQAYTPATETLVQPMLSQHSITQYYTREQHLPQSQVEQNYQHASLEPRYMPTSGPTGVADDYMDRARCGRAGNAPVILDPFMNLNNIINFTFAPSSTAM